MRMAEIKINIYKCAKCSYEVRTTPSGRIALAGWIFNNFSCSHCKQIVEIHHDSFEGDTLICSNCKESGCLTCWNPTDGYCPKCKNQKMDFIGEYSVFDE